LVESSYTDKREGNESFSEEIKVRNGRSRYLKWFIPNGGAILLVCLLILIQRVWASPAQNSDAPGPSATTINYQGNLASPNGSPKNGSFDMSFAIYNAASGGRRFHPKRPFPGHS